MSREHFDVVIVIVVNVVFCRIHLFLFYHYITILITARYYTLVSRFVVSLELLYITLGFFASIGLELTYVSAILEVTKGFRDDKFMGLAIGLTVSGSGIGVFTFNPLLNYLINEYTWKGALTIESAIFLHIILAGIIFKLASTFISYAEAETEANLKVIDVKGKINIEIINIDEDNRSTNNTIQHSFSSTAVNNISVINEEDKHNHLPGISKPIVKNPEQRSSVFLSMTQTKYCEPFYKPINCQTKSASLDRKFNTGDNFSVSLPVDERNASFVRRLSLYSNQNVKGSQRGSQETLSSKPSLLFENSEAEVIDINFSTDKVYDNGVQEMKNNSISTYQTKWQLFVDNLKMSLFPLISRKIWTNKNLILFYVISFLFSFSVVVIWTFSYNHSLLIGIDSTSASFLISLTGAGSCIGQIIFGLLSAYVPAVSLYLIGCAFAGSIIIVMRWVTAYAMLSCLHFTFGFSQGVCYALFPVILLHYTSNDLYPASLGIYLLSSGCGNLIGTLIPGYIFDVTKTYEFAYLLSGFVLILCSVLAIPLVYVWHMEKFTKINICN